MSAWTSCEAADARVLAHSGPEALADLIRTRKVLEALQRRHNARKAPRPKFTPQQMAIALRSLERTAA